MRPLIPFSRHIAFFALLLVFASATASPILATQTVHTTPRPNGSADPTGDLGTHNHYIRGEGDLPQPGSPKASTSPLGVDEVPKTVFPKKEPGYLHHSESIKRTSENAKVLFEPQKLNFHDRPIGIPVVELIRVQNDDDSKDLVISSISHDSSLFQLKFYRPITIAPKSNTSIEIVLVARSIGAFESQIVFSTSCGSFTIELVGIMTPNPYRLSTFMSVKVPVGELFEPTIVLYNPHYEVLSVKEIYTSSGFLHLQLPNESHNFSATEFESNTIDGGTETKSLKFWDLQPHESKSIINLHFQSYKSGKFQDIVTIQTNFDELMIHVDVSVVSGSLHKMPEELDFGTLTVQDTKHLTLSLLNSGSTTLQVTDLHVMGATDPNLSLELLPTILLPNHQAAVANLAYHARSEGTFKGKLLLRTNDTNPVHTQIQILYRVRVLSGYISYLTAQTTFPAFDAEVYQKGELVKVNALAPTNQELILTNKFSVPLVLYSAEIDDTQLRVVNFIPSQQAEPGESWPALTIEFRPKLAHLQLFTTHLHLITNATLISIPLHIYHGKLVYTMPAETHWYSVGPLALQNSEKAVLLASHADILPSYTHVHKHAFQVQPLDVAFGTIPINEVQTHTLNISNPNPVKLSLLALWTNLEGLSIKLESVWNAQGYRSVADIAFQVHKPSYLDDRSNSASSASSSRSTGTNGPSKGSDKKKSPKSKANSSAETARNAVAPVLEILPGQSVLLSLELLSTREMKGQGYIYFESAQERSAINVTFHSLAGNLALFPSSFTFDHSLTTEVPLYLQHSYSQSVTVTSITSNDERLQVRMPKSADSSIGSQDERHLWLQPHKQVAFGSVYFKPLFGPKSLVQVQAESVAVDPNVDFLTASGAEILLKRVEEVDQGRQQPLKAILTVKTDLPTTHGFSVEVERWRSNLLALNPELKRGVLDFGVAEVEVGEQTLIFDLQNPCTENSLQVQLQLSTEAYLHPATADWHATPATALKNCVGAFDFAEAGSTRLETLGPNEMRRFGPIVFHPDFEGRCISTLYIRNNFSTIETVTLHGVGAGGQIDFEPKLKRSTAARAKASLLDVEDIAETSTKAKEILFQVKDTELDGCEENEASTKANPSATVTNGNSKAKRMEWRAPVLTETVSVFNRGNLPLAVEAVFIAPKLPSGKLRTMTTKASITAERLETATGAWKHKSFSASSGVASKPSQANSLGGFQVGSAEDATSVVLWPGARRFVEIIFSPDFSALESQYDLVIRTNSSREFRFPLRGVISEQKLASCGHRFTNSLKSRQSSSFLDVRFGLIIIACLILLGLYAERRWTASKHSEEQLPSLHTPKVTVDKTSPSKNGHDHDKSDTTSAKSHRRAPEDLESHSPPTSVSKPSSGSNAPSASKEKKKDKKDTKNTNAASNDKTSQSTSKPKKSKKDSKSSMTLGSDQCAANNAKLTCEAVEPVNSQAHIVSTSIAPISFSSPAVAPSAALPGPSGSKKKDKKDKKELWPSGSPVEPNFGAVPSSPPGDERMHGIKDSASGTTSPNAEVPERKRKKSVGATSAPPAGENRESSPVVANGASSPPVAPLEREKSTSEKKMPVNEARQASPPQQRPQTLVPAKRPSSKPMPKYARKDGLNKDGTTPSMVSAGVGAPVNGERVSETLQASTAPVPGSVAPTSLSTKESKKQRTKEQRKAERQALALEKSQKGEKGDVLGDISASQASQVPQAKVSDTSRVLPSFGPTQSAQNPWMQPSPFLASQSTAGAVPQLQVINPAGGMYLPPSGATPALASPSGSAPSNFGSLGLGSSLTSDAPLLVSPGALSANRYDYGRRGHGPLKSSGGHGSNSFDFSIAPSFDTGSLSRENSITPPLNMGSGPQPPMRLYNPMAPQGSVENLLASLRDPELSSSEPGSVSSTPRDYMMWNSLMMGAQGASSGSSDSLLDPAWQSLTHGSIWSIPTSERAVEENASNLSLLGLGGSPIVPHARNISPPSEVDPTGGHEPSFHRQLFPGAPMMPPGLHFAASGSATPSPPTTSDGSPELQTPTSFFSSKLNDSGDLWNTTRF